MPSFPLAKLRREKSGLAPNLITCQVLAIKESGLQAVVKLEPRTVPDLSIGCDGTAVPVCKDQTARRAGQQPNDSAKTHAAKLAVVCTAELVHPGFRRRVVLWNGAVGIWQVDSEELPGAIQIVDLWHTKEPLGAVGRALGLDEAARKDLGAEPSLCIGPGVADVVCKTVVRCRLKNAGMRWTTAWPTPSWPCSPALLPAQRPVRLLLGMPVPPYGGPLLLTESPHYLHVSERFALCFLRVFRHGQEIKMMSYSHETVVVCTGEGVCGIILGLQRERSQ